MAIRHKSALMAAIGMLVVAIPLSASGSKSGEEVYTQMCSACHSAGVAGAPKVGDQKAWAPLIAEGQHIVTAHGWVGVRAMPPRGGDPGLELEEFARATAHMANTAGGDWGEPDDALLERIRDEEAKRIEALQQAEQPVSEAALKSGEQVYAQICSACHQGGVAGAPMLGGKQAWAPLIEEGQAVVTAHGWVGVRAMPPKGGKPGLRLEEFARATAYMARTAGADWSDPDESMMAHIRHEEAERIEDLKEK